MAGFFKSHLQSYFHGDSLPIIAALSVKNRCVCWIPWPTGLGWLLHWWGGDACQYPLVDFVNWRWDTTSQTVLLKGRQNGYGISTELTISTGHRKTQVLCSAAEAVKLHHVQSSITNPYITLHMHRRWTYVRTVILNWAVCCVFYLPLGPCRLIGFFGYGHRFWHHASTLRSGKHRLCQTQRSATRWSFIDLERRLPYLLLILHAANKCVRCSSWLRHVSIFARVSRPLVISRVCDASWDYSLCSWCRWYIMLLPLRLVVLVPSRVYIWMYV